MKKISLKTAQIAEASNLGSLAFKNGINCAPCLDANLLKMPAFSRQIGEKVSGQATTIEIMKAWISSWHRENFAANEFVY
jgi:hypothetical protein